MTGTYDATARRALATIRRKGAPVTFTFLAGDGTYLADLDMETYQGPVTVSGYAIKDDTNTSLGGRPLARQPDSQASADAPTLLFAPSTPGQLPEPDMLVVWAGHSYSVLTVDPIAPAGTAIVARIVVTR